MAMPKEVASNETSGWPWMGMMEGMVGVVLVFLAVIAVLLLIALCWGVAWKISLSQLGLFRALFGSERRPVPRPILVEGERRRPQRGGIRFAEPEEEKPPEGGVGSAVSLTGDASGDSTPTEKSPDVSKEAAATVVRKRK